MRKTGIFLFVLLLAVPGIYGAMVQHTCSAQVECWPAWDETIDFLESIV